MNFSARTWTRWALGISLLVSVIGNVTHSVLAASEISLWLRTPGGVIWPFFAFLGIEIFVRVAWERKFSHYFGRVAILLPILPAAVVSYRHLYSLLGLMGEDDFTQQFGPAAIDGMMIGCTIVLLVTRENLAPAREHSFSSIFTPVEEVLPREEVLPVIEEEKEEILPIPVSAPPADEKAPRAPWDGRKVVEMILDGAKNSEIQGATGVALAPLGHLKRAVRVLQQDPRGPLPDGVRVSGANLSIIRELVTR